MPPCYAGHCHGTKLMIWVSYYAGHATLMKSVVKPGYEFDQLLVLGTLNLWSNFQSSYVPAQKK